MQSSNNDITFFHNWPLQQKLVFLFHFRDDTFANKSINFAAAAFWYRRKEVCVVVLIFCYNNNVFV